MRRGLTTLLLALTVPALAGVGPVQAAEEQTPQTPAADEPPEAKQPAVLLFGQIAWPGVSWFGGGNVALCRDDHFRQTVAVVPIHTNGRFAQMVPPGTYYLRAVVDLNGDGKVGPDDGLGFYGVEDPSDRPKALELQPEGDAELTVIRVIFQFGPDMKLVRAKTGLRAVLCTAVGQVKTPQPGPTYVVLWSTTSDWFGYVFRVGQDGPFELKVPPGPYALMAFCDANGDATLDVAEPGLVLLDDKGKPRVFSLLPCGRLELGTLALGDHFQPPRPRPGIPVQ
ncbi:MAG: hypothetical protein J7M26_07575, partial [Armatimonadetes bacterium]|nr:hypothetical protein [Armatimonadota bacterium]